MEIQLVKKYPQVCLYGSLYPRSRCMKIVKRSVLGQPDDSLPVRTFPAVASLSNSTLLATCRAGSGKDTDDGIIEMYVSTDNGDTWGEPKIPFRKTVINSRKGAFQLCYLTETEPGHILAAAMWVDRGKYPGRPLFNPDTEGCLPMKILLSDSYDFGSSWSAFREVPMPEEIGPPSLTNPVLKFADGSLGMSIETNKPYEDNTKWYQRVVLFFSKDNGAAWGDMAVVGFDPTGRIFNWDQRMGVAGNGTTAAYAWTYDNEARKYLNIHRRLSTDNGNSWSVPVDIGVTDQAGHPAILSDGRVFLCWVDRFHTHSIRARLSPGIVQDFDADSEIELYNHSSPQSRGDKQDTTGDMLEDMSLWTFGLPYAEALPGGDVIVLYYAGDNRKMDIHLLRISV